MGMLEFSNNHEGVCQGCAVGKHTRGPFPSSVTKTSDVLQLVHSDLFGMLPVTSLGGCSYYMRQTSSRTFAKELASRGRPQCLWATTKLRRPIKYMCLVKGNPRIPVSDTYPYRIRPQFKGYGVSVRGTIGIRRVRKGIRRIPIVPRRIRRIPYNRVRLGPRQEKSRYFFY